MAIGQPPSPAAPIDSSESTDLHAPTGAPTGTVASPLHSRAWPLGTEANRCLGKVAGFLVAVPPPGRAGVVDHLGPHSPLETVLYLALLLVLLAMLVVAVRRR